jgi:hypothetical protein
MATINKRKESRIIHKFTKHLVSNVRQDQIFILPVVEDNKY